MSRNSFSISLRTTNSQKKMYDEGYRFESGIQSYFEDIYIVDGESDSDDRTYGKKGRTAFYPYSFSAVQRDEAIRNHVGFCTMDGKVKSVYCDECHRQFSLDEVDLHHQPQLAARAKDKSIKDRKADFYDPIMLMGLCHECHKRYHNTHPMDHYPKF